jgi:hypothetical protein
MFLSWSNETVNDNLFMRKYRQYINDVFHGKCGLAPGCSCSRCLDQPVLDMFDNLRLYNAGIAICEQSRQAWVALITGRSRSPSVGQAVWANICALCEFVGWPPARLLPGELRGRLPSRATWFGLEQRRQLGMGCVQSLRWWIVERLPSRMLREGAPGGRYDGPRVLAMMPTRARVDPPLRIRLGA